jgi:hypothetical protein
MKIRFARILMRLASPQVGNEVRKAIRELARVAGVRRVAARAKVPHLLSIDYDPKVIQAAVLLHYVRRGWAGARLV